MLSLDKLDQPVNPVGVVDRIRTQPKKLLPGKFYFVAHKASFPFFRI
jgi:hypothetical protein